METPETLQADLQGWEGLEAPPKLDAVRASGGYQAMRPAARVQAINQAQKNWANWLREKAPDYGGTYPDMVRGLETDYSKARAEEVENGLAGDLATGALTETQVASYLKQGTAALTNEGEAAGYVQQRYGADADLAGPWVTHKLAVRGADGKPAGFAYLRHDPRTTGENLKPGNDRVEVSYQINGKKPVTGKVGGIEVMDMGDTPELITGTADVNVTGTLTEAQRARDLIRQQAEAGANPEAGYYPPKLTDDVHATAALLDVPASQLPGVLAARAFSAQAQNDPAIADKLGQGFWKGLPGEAAKGFLSLGAATVHGPGALLGSRESLKNWQQGTRDIESDIEGQSRLAFKGGTWNNVLKSVSSEAIPMAFSMGSSALGRIVQKGVASAVGKTFLSRMAALEMENAAQQGAQGLTREAMAKTLAGELTGEGTGTTAKQTLTASLSRGLFGKWLGTAEIESNLGRALADRVSNAVAFLPSSARSGLQNIATTLDAAEQARAAGDETKAKELEDSAIMNGWAGLGIETLSENLFLNEMLVTRAARPLSKVATDVLERRLAPGKLAAITGRMSEALRQFAVRGAEEGSEEIAAGVGNRAWLNNFAAQNADLVKDIPQEFLAGALLGGLMGAAKGMAQKGQPAVFNELVQRGLDGNPDATAALARIRTKAAAVTDNSPDKPPTVGVGSQGAPDAAGPNSGTGPAALPSPRGAVTRLPALASGNLSSPAVGVGQMVEPTGILPVVPGSSPGAAAGGEITYETAQTPPGQTPELAAAPAAPQLSTPDTAETPQIPDTAAPVAEQARMAADKSTPQRAVLIPPGTPMPPRTPGLKAFQGDTNGHGTVLYNPRKITPAEIRTAVAGPAPDLAALGMPPLNPQVPQNAPIQPTRAPSPPIEASELPPLNPQVPPNGPIQSTSAPGPTAAQTPFAGKGDNLRSRQDTGTGLRGVTGKAADDAITMLKSNAPELVRNVLLLRDDPSRPPSVQAYYNTATGQTVLLLDRIRVRDGETPIGAVARVVQHERIGHAGFAILQKQDPEFARRWKSLTDEIPMEELAALLPNYPHLAEEPEILKEEWFAHQAEKVDPAKAPAASLLRRMWEALKAAVAKLWRGFSTPKGMTLDQRLREFIAASRRALTVDAATNSTPPPAGSIGSFENREGFRDSRNPFENRDWQSVPLPSWLKPAVRAVAAYEVQQQTLRAVLTGSSLPAEFARLAATTQEEIRAIQTHGAIIGKDLLKAMGGYEKRSGQTAMQVADLVNAAMEDPAVMGSLTDPVLKTRATTVRNFIDTLSNEVAATTGGTLGATIRANAGHWLRRSYAVFDGSANWNYKSLTEAASAGRQVGGKDARTILTNARNYLTAQNPGVTPAGIEIMIAELLNRSQWQAIASGSDDGTKITRTTSSFMARKDIAAPIRALLGEETNPIKRLAKSLSTQAQLIARYDQQRAMRDLGLRMGIFSTVQDTTYVEPVGGDDVHGNMRWNGFAWTDPSTGKVQPVYTTPEMLAALDTSTVPEFSGIGGMILQAVHALSGIAKMNKVALSPDFIAPNIFGNITAIIQSGDVFHWAGWKNIAEAVRIHNSSGAHSGDTLNAVAEAIKDARRSVLTRLASAGVAGASFDMRDLESTIDNSLLALIEEGSLTDRAAGLGQGALIGQSLGKTFGPGVGRLAGAAVGAVGGAIVGGKKITSVQRRLAQLIVASPDNIGKIAVYLGNFASQLSAGLAPDAAHVKAAEITRNTMPDYTKLPALIREMSRLGLGIGSFVAFQHEVYRNYYWNVRYAVQELRSGNNALVRRGMRRMLGAATMTALGGGIIALVVGAVRGTGDDDKDKAFRRSLGKPWERFSELAYTDMNREQASFFNTSYLVPQSSLVEILRGAWEGRSFEESMSNALGAARKQFAGGSVHTDPLLEAIMNARVSGGKVSYEEGWRKTLELLDHFSGVSLETGLANKLERMGQAYRGEERNGRKFSFKEEGLRVLGARQVTTRFEDRMHNAIGAMRAAYQDARTQARKLWENTPQPQDRDRALDRGNERIAAVEQRWQEFLTDMKTLGISSNKVESIRREVGLGAKFYRLKPGKDGPESAPE